MSLPMYEVLLREEFNRMVYSIIHYNAPMLPVAFASYGIMSPLLCSWQSFYKPTDKPSSIWV